MKTVFTSLFFFLFTSLLLEISAQVWEPKALGTLSGGYYVSSISIVSEQIIWATAYNYDQPTPPVPANHVITILKSTDGGETWEVKDVEEAMGRISFDIHAFDENTACITTQNLGPSGGRGIFRTTDGGETWTEVFNSGAGGVWIHFFDDEEGIAINAWAMGKTTDGGVNWMPSTIPSFQPGEGTILATGETSLEVIGDILWFGTSKGRIFRSLNRGENWDTYASSLGDTTTIFSIAFVNEKNGIALYFNDSGDNQLAKSSDGGESWTPVDYEYKFNEVIAIPCSGVFMGVSWQDSITAISTDFGGTWELLDDQTSPWTPTFNSPNLGWMGEGGLNGVNTPALYKWVGNPLYGRTYVNQNATGNNDGTSWADAYNDLQDALANAAEGNEIWVAEGTYLPGNDADATFSIDKDIKLYGGFAGTECELSERDIEQYPTILSGDVNGDDMEDDFDNFKSDNVMTVVEITSDITNTTLLDGFTIRGGYADGNGSISENGGGVYSVGSPVFQNCSFEQNYALVSGGGLYLNGNISQGTVIENCRFEKNRADETFNAGGGLYAGMIHGVGVSVKNSHFIENEVAGRGGGLACFRSNMTVTNSTFTSNTNDRQGGGLWFWAEDSGLTLLVDSCTFTGNHSSFGGGLYAALRANSIATITNSEFEGNMVSPNNDGWTQGGGGVFLGAAPNFTGASLSLDNCLFHGNTSTGGESAVYVPIGGNNVTASLTNSIFRENESTNFFATVGIWTMESSSGDITVENCLLENNMGVFNAGLGMGSGPNAGPATFTVRNCQMLNNHATRYNGGLYLWAEENSSPTILVEDCQIIGNSAVERAGGIGIDGGSNNFHATLERCIIQGNNSPWGSAIGAFLSNPDILPTGSAFSLNNSLVTGNTGGGTIMLDSFPGFQMVNATVANNAGTGIALSDLSGLILQNTILYNPGFSEYEELTNDVTGISNGGNLIGDGSFSAHALPQDFEDKDPQFAGLGDLCEYYRPSENSLAINAGTEPDNSSDLDLCGNERIQNGHIDIGALESDFTATREVLADDFELDISPNPATNFLNIHFPETIIQPIEISLFDLNGKMMGRQIISQGHAIDLKGLAKGMYLAKGIVGEKIYVGRFIKQ